jgi:hypothetical protein
MTVAQVNGYQTEDDRQRVGDEVTASRHQTEGMRG